jgi:hypothetical protein
MEMSDHASEQLIRAVTSDLRPPSRRHLKSPETPTLFFNLEESKSQSRLRQVAYY